MVTNNPNDGSVRHFIDSVCALLSEVQHEHLNIQQDANRCEFFANRLLVALRHIYNIVLFCERSTDFPGEVVTELKLLRSNLKSLYSDLYSLPAMNSYSYRPTVERNGQRGRPCFLISEEQLQCLRSEFNSWADIARDLGVSRQTIYNRRRELGFSLTFERYSTIADEDLDAIVRSEQDQFPGTGETNMIAGLRRQGVFVQRWRVRESIGRVDPIGRANRWAERIVRRPYSVPHPNFLWHIDSNMKLCHWRLCIHGGVDGYSRCIVYLKVHNNNRALTVLNSFQGATSMWGHPSRVRADDGGENIAVGEYISWFRGLNRGSYLTGPSVRNTRIERLWRDVGEGVISTYRHLFLHMEAHNLLDAGQDMDMFALHYVFIPRLQKSLDNFSERFNYHSISSAGNRTPRQLWASGCLQNYSSPNSGVEREEKERVRKEREEKERVEKERKEREEKERVEKERKEREEKERVEKERKEREEKERVEKERKEREEKERLEKERARLERERVEREREEQEEKEREDREEKERLMKEKKEREEQERVERKRKEKEDRERAERKRKEREEKERVERERKEREEKERVERERKDREDNERGRKDQEEKEETHEETKKQAKRKRRRQKEKEAKRVKF